MSDRLERLVALLFYRDPAIVMRQVTAGSPHPASAIPSRSVCGSHKNGSCRWGEAVTYCFYDDDHHPPLTMRVGGTLQVNGREWVLVSRAGSHSGSSFCLSAPFGAISRHLPRASQKKRNRAQLQS